MTTRTLARPAAADPSLSLFQLLDPEVLADPYPLYRRVRAQGPVRWDPFVHSWVVTGYAEVVTALGKFSSDRTPKPEFLRRSGLESLEPMARVMARQMLFQDPPEHARLRKLCAAAFAPRRIELLRENVGRICEGLLDRVAHQGRMDVIADFAAPMPAIVMADLLGVPTEDHAKLKSWSADFADLLGNFQHDPERAAQVLRSLEELQLYVAGAMRDQAREPRDGLIRALMQAEAEGTRLSEEEVIANVVITLVAGLETSTNLIGNGLLVLLRTSGALARLRDEPALLPAAIEELLRYDTPSHHTGRVVPHDLELGGETLRAGDPVTVVMAAANRDPSRFADPDRLNFDRTENRHLSFGWGSHFCFGATLARLESQVAFAALLRRLPDLALLERRPTWRANLGLRGLTSLNVSFSRDGAAAAARRGTQTPQVT